MNATERNNSLPRAKRLEAALYPAVFDRKASFAGRYMVLCAGPASGLPHAQLGVAVSRRTLGAAVDRNRARRLLREAFRTRQHHLLPGARMILVARKRLAEDGCLATVSRDFRALCERAGIWVQAGAPTS